MTPDGLDAGDPDWSPDGSWIVFGPTPLHLWLYGLDQTDWQIRAIRPDGTDLHTVVPGGDAATPSWTAHGTRILFTELSGAKSVIRSVRPDGSDLQDVLTFQSRDILMYPIQQPTP